MNDLSDSEKLILLFLYIWERPIRAEDLFQILSNEYGFTRSRQTLYSVIKKLRNNHYLMWKAHKLVELTDQGKEYALHIRWHMHLLERYFQETLYLSKEIIRKEALRLTPEVSCDLINAVALKFHKDVHDCELKEAVKAEKICLNERKL